MEYTLTPVRYVLVKLLSMKASEVVPVFETTSGSSTVASHSNHDDISALNFLAPFNEDIYQAAVFNEKYWTSSFIMSKGFSIWLLISKSIGTLANSAANNTLRQDTSLVLVINFILTGLDRVVYSDCST